MTRISFCLLASLVSVSGMSVVCFWSPLLARFTAAYCWLHIMHNKLALHSNTVECAVCRIRSVLVYAMLFRLKTGVLKSE